MNKRLVEKVCIISIGILILTGVGYALNLSRVKEWGTEILTAADLNAEFDNIVDHAITNSDISATAAIVASKIDYTTASAIGSTTPSTGAFTTLSTTGAIAANGDSITCDGVLVINATSTTSFNDESITNVGDIKLDTVSADNGTSFAMGNNWTSAGKTVADLGSVTTCDINGGTITGITDLAVADGGTASSTAAAARTALSAAALGANTDITSLGGITDGSGSKNIFNRITYEGNSTDDRNIAHGLGRTPEIVLICADPSDSAQYSILWMSGFSSGYSHSIGTGGALTDSIQSVDGTNVQVGGHSTVNLNTKTFVLWCM